MNKFSPIAKADSATAFSFLPNTVSVVVGGGFQYSLLFPFFISWLQLRDSNSRVFVQVFLLSSFVLLPSIYRPRTPEPIHAAIATSVFLGYLCAPFSTIQRQI